MSRAVIQTANTMKTQTSTSILGAEFYITWENDKIGYDQRGIKWINKNNPQCTDERIVNICLDTYNDIMKLNQTCKIKK